MLLNQTIALSPKSLPQEVEDDGLFGDSISQFIQNDFSLEEDLSLEFLRMFNLLPEQSLNHSTGIVDQSTSQYQDVQNHRDHSILHPESQAILSQYWRPCFGGTSIGEHLDCTQFPVSYRDLVYRWIALDRPSLSSFQVPTTIRSTICLPSKPSNYSSELSNLQQLCEKQESVIIESVKTYFNTGQLQNSMTFIDFASHLEIYCALHAELTCLESRCSQNTSMQRWLFEKIWRDMLKAFEMDRSVCKARYSHQCFWRLLWGEVYDWSTRKIEEEFIRYKFQFSSIRSAQANLTKQESSAIQYTLTSSFFLPSIGDCKTTLDSLIAQSASLSYRLSDFGLTVSEVETPITSPAGNSSSRKSTSGLDTFESPSSGIISIPASSPGHINTYQTDLACNISTNLTEQKCGDTTSVLLQLQTIGLQIDSDTNRRQSRCLSQSSSELVQSPILIPYSSSQSPASMKVKKVYNRMAEALPTGSSPFEEYSQQLTKKRRSSSIGSSFETSEALIKIGRYRTVFKDVAANFDVASRLLSDQAINLHPQSPTQKQSHQAVSNVATASAIATQAVKTPAKRARSNDNNNISRPVQSRSQSGL